MNTSMAPTKSTGPKPLKKYPKNFWKVCDLGGDGAFRPYSFCLRVTCSSERPSVIDTLRRRRASSVEIVCHSREDSSAPTVLATSADEAWSRGYGPLVATSSVFGSVATSCCLDSSIWNDLETGC